MPTAMKPTAALHLDPIAAVNQPREDLIRYLLTAYPLSDRHLRYGFKQLLEQPGNIWQEPYLEGSQPYRSDLSVAQLVKDGVLHSEMAHIFAPKDRSLYEHQVKAVRSVVEEQANIVVATGTGSGKTECFLLPMFNMLLEKKQSALPGVRALILYPMNALVNDQVKRLRKLLCKQQQSNIRFGFYTSRTESDPEKAKEMLREELRTYEDKELQELFAEAEEIPSSRDKLLDRAIENVASIQAISRQEIQQNPPHILVTNYSMLEHMLIRPVERNQIFKASQNTFKLLVVDEAHTYNGSTGSEVATLLERLKVAVGNEQQQKIRCIATSASLGDSSKDLEVLDFMAAFFGEPFDRVIRGDRVEALERLGQPYTLEHGDYQILEALAALRLPAITDSIEHWREQLKAFVPAQQLANAFKAENGDVHKFLWQALKPHPLYHRLINILNGKPQPWKNISSSLDLWGNVDTEEIGVAICEKALSHLLQLGTLARPDQETLPLLPVRIHLLFRGLEGLYACINPQCSGKFSDPEYADHPTRYGRLYLKEKHVCEDCSSPVLELGSCSQCGQGYAFAQIADDGKLKSLPRSNQFLQDNKQIHTLTSGHLQSVTEEDDTNEEQEEQTHTPQTLIFRNRDGWIGVPVKRDFIETISETNEFQLAWHRCKSDKGEAAGYLSKCAACGLRPTLSQAINRLITYTDRPLQTAIDSLFDLLPETDQKAGELSKRKLLVFSDSRQDAAFFAADHQRSSTENVYRQILWQAFQAVKDSESVASIGQLTEAIKSSFLEIPIPHPDRSSSDNHKSYCLTSEEDSFDHEKDCQDKAERRAKEILVREFALTFNRRSSVESHTMLGCHMSFSSSVNPLFDSIAERFKISQPEAKIFVTALTDIIRRTGVVNIEGCSDYFPETGGIEGKRPAMIVAGKSKNYLFLEKSESDRKSYADSPSFMPKWKKDGGVSKAQNRLGWYYQQLFGMHFPAREDFSWLFEQLQAHKLIVSAKSGYQLKWGNLSVFETTKDWYQCDRCQQNFHVPDLSLVKNPTLNIRGCPTFRCEGTLKTYSPEQIAQARAEHHQQYIITEKLPLPLRSQEHTAQLSTGELEKRENRFRRGQINMLSCSTTLEMGVDIGELQAVALRNFPPHVSNYQQRAGRAGRRTDGVAITLMYGQRRPHDRYYFDDPAKLIAGNNQIPAVDKNNVQIQERHIRAELLAAFLADKDGRGAEKIRLGNFLSLSIDSTNLSATLMVDEFQLWLKDNFAQQRTREWLTRLNSSNHEGKLLEDFRAAIEKFRAGISIEWESLYKPLREVREDLDAKPDRKKRDTLRNYEGSLERALEKIADRRLHDAFVQASILPIYGFPIDVVRLLTEESSEFKSHQDKHRLERDRRMALGEYAPGQKIVVDDRVYASVGVVGPQKLETKYYWVCKSCNHFQSSMKQETIEECPSCYQEINSVAQQKMKPYKIPKSFMTDWSNKAEVTPHLKPQRQGTSEVFLAQDGQDVATINHKFYQLKVSSNGTFFLANQGLNRDKGFAICACGRDLTALVVKNRQEKKAKSKKSKDVASNDSSVQALKHKNPMTGRDCKPWYEEIHLGHEFRSDLLKISFSQATNPPVCRTEVKNFVDGSTVSSVSEESSGGGGLNFWRSLNYTLLAAAALVIDVPRNELDGLFRPGDNGSTEIVIYDNVPGGAGYSKRIANRFSEVLAKAYEISSQCDCGKSCYECLRTYSNQLFHNDLDRNEVAKFLEEIISLQQY
jgi:ATP-dependent helicase YprA (DUF1998 family)